MGSTNFNPSHPEMADPPNLLESLKNSILRNQLGMDCKYTNDIFGYWHNLYWLELTKKSKKLREIHRHNQHLFRQLELESLKNEPSMSTSITYIMIP
jgi:hypothetical protein